MMSPDHDELFPKSLTDLFYEIFAAALIALGLALGIAAPALWAGAVISALRRSPTPTEIPCYAPGSQVAPASSPSCSNR